jgi:hypothetical protein
MDINFIRAGIGISNINAICYKNTDLKLFKKINDFK